MWPKQGTRGWRGIVNSFAISWIGYLILVMKPDRCGRANERVVYVAVARARDNRRAPASEQSYRKKASQESYERVIMERNYCYHAN
jgi:hypothetical protein